MAKSITRQALLEPCRAGFSHPDDPLSQTDGIAFDRVSISDAGRLVDACEAEVRHHGRKASLVYVMARARERRDGIGSEQSLREYREAASAGNPIAHNNLALALSRKSNTEESRRESLRFVNRVFHCCAREAVRALLASKEPLDPKEVNEAVRMLLAWATDLGSPGALELAAEYTLSGRLAPPDGGRKEVEAYFHLRRAEKGYATGESDRAYERNEDAEGEKRTRAGADALHAALSAAERAAVEKRLIAWSPKAFDDRPEWMTAPPITR